MPAERKHSSRRSFLPSRSRPRLSQPNLLLLFCRRKLSPQNRWPPCYPRRRAGAATAHGGAARKYVNLKVWKAVQTLLFERAEKMSIEEIARELKAGGASLGDSPVRTVATAVGYMNTKIFHVTKSGGKTLVDLIARN